MIAALDPRDHHPFGRPNQKLTGPSLAEVTDSFVGYPCRETSAILAVLAVMGGDELVRGRARRALLQRTDELPSWLEGLGQARVDRTVEMVHVLGDGDNVMLALHLIGGHELTVVVYIDHNVGTVTKDAYLVPQPLTEVMSLMRKASDDDPDTTWRDLDPGDARVRISDAIQHGSIMYPPFESDTWPGCRPLVEWVTRMLPEGGTGYQRPDWDDDATAELAERFFASPFGSNVDDADHRSRLESLLWYGTDYGPGDPMRWSPVVVEILLNDWLPRKIVADASYLAKFPQLMRRFIRYCHHERGIRAELTAETLAAVTEWEPEYQRTIRSPRPQGPEAILARIGAIDPDGLVAAAIGDDEPSTDDDDSFDGLLDELGADDPALQLILTSELFLQSVDLDDEDEIAQVAVELGPVNVPAKLLDLLAQSVGGMDALDALNDDPLPDEDFSWESVPERREVRARVDEILRLCDRCCDTLLDVEYRTATRRLLSRVARNDPTPLLRGRAETAAAAVAWVVGKANDLYNPASAPNIRVKDLMAHFGLKQSSVSTRATPLLEAAGFDADVDEGLEPFAPELMVSSMRRTGVERRDRWRYLSDRFAAYGSTL
jgi:hypothetical protein